MASKSRLLSTVNVVKKIPAPAESSSNRRSSGGRSTQGGRTDRYAPYSSRSRDRGRDNNNRNDRNDNNTNYNEDIGSRVSNPTVGGSDRDLFLSDTGAGGGVSGKARVPRRGNPSGKRGGRGGHRGSATGNNNGQLRIPTGSGFRAPLDPADEDLRHALAGQEKVRLDRGQKVTIPSGRDFNAAGVPRSDTDLRHALEGKERGNMGQHKGLHIPTGRDSGQDVKGRVGRAQKDLRAALEGNEQRRHLTRQQQLVIPTGKSMAGTHLGEDMRWAPGQVPSFMASKGGVIATEVYAREVDAEWGIQPRAVVERNRAKQKKLQQEAKRQAQYQAPPPGWQGAGFNHDNRALVAAADTQRNVRRNVKVDVYKPGNPNTNGKWGHDMYFAKQQFHQDTAGGFGRF